MKQAIFRTAALFMCARFGPLPVRALPGRAGSTPRRARRTLGPPSGSCRALNGESLVTNWVYGSISKMDFDSVVNESINRCFGLTWFKNLVERKPGEKPDGPGSLYWTAPFQRRLEQWQAYSREYRAIAEATGEPSAPRPHPPIAALGRILRVSKAFH